MKRPRPVAASVKRCMRSMWASGKEWATASHTPAGPGPLGYDRPKEAPMSESRREFLARTAAGLVGAAAAGKALGKQQPSPQPTASSAAGTPPAFGTAPPVGPEISVATIAEAEKLVRIEITPAEKAQMAVNWRQSMAATMERRTGPRKVALETTLSPASRWNPLIPGVAPGPSRDRFVRPRGPRGRCPEGRGHRVRHRRRAVALDRVAGALLRTADADLPRAHGALDPKMRCIITLTPDHALAQAQQADAEIAAGSYRGPLHGIPFGVKDLLDTKGILTTYGAEPYRNRVPRRGRRRRRAAPRAGAVLVAKLSLGALALNDIWFGGQTMNPWLPRRAPAAAARDRAPRRRPALVASRSAARPAAASSIPRCAAASTGLRPTFGRVARTGAMTLCWSLDKLGPMTRGVEDTMLVLAAISGPDPGDLSSVPSHLDFDATAP